MTHNILETIVGAIVVTVALGFVMFSSHFGNWHTPEQHIYKANFDRIDGIVIGADVKISGVKVGMVKSMHVNPSTYLAEVTLSMDPQIHLPKDSSAQIVSEGLLGGKYIAIVPGGEEVFLTKEDNGIVYTQSSVNLESLIGQMMFSSKGNPEDSKNASSSKPDKL